MSCRTCATLNMRKSHAAAAVARAARLASRDLERLGFIRDKTALEVEVAKRDREEVLRTAASHEKGHTDE